MYSACVAEYASEEFYARDRARWTADMAQLEELAELQIISGILKAKSTGTLSLQFLRMKIFNDFDCVASAAYYDLPDVPEFPETADKKSKEVVSLRPVEFFKDCAHVKS